MIALEASMAPIALNLFAALGLTPSAPKAVDTGPPVAGGPPQFAAGLQKEVDANEQKPQATLLDLLEQIQSWIAPRDAVAVSTSVEQPTGSLELQLGGKKLKLDLSEAVATLGAIAQFINPPAVSEAGATQAPLVEADVVQALQRASQDKSLPETVRVVLGLFAEAAQSESEQAPVRMANPALPRLTPPPPSPTREANPALNRFVQAAPPLGSKEAEVAGARPPSKSDRDGAAEPRPMVATARSKAFLARLMAVYGERPKADGAIAKSDNKTPQPEFSNGSGLNVRIANPAGPRLTVPNPIPQTSARPEATFAPSPKAVVANILSKHPIDGRLRPDQSLEKKIVSSLGLNSIDVDAIDPRPLGGPITVVPAPMPNAAIETLTRDGMQALVGPRPVVKSVDKEIGKLESLELETPVSEPKLASGTKSAEVTDQKVELEDASEKEVLAKTEPKETEPTLFARHTETTRRTTGVEARPSITDKQSFEVTKRVVETVQELAAMRGRNTVTLRLNPEELGTLTLTVSSSQENVEAKVTASHEAVRHALAAHRDQLVQSIESRGLELGSFSVGHEDRQGTGQESRDMRQDFARARNLADTQSLATERPHFSTGLTTKGVDTLA